MKIPNLSELVRTCIRCWLYLVPQAFLGIHLFDMFMRRKNSIKPLMIWQLLRVFLIGGISDIILRGYYGDGELVGNSDDVLFGCHHDSKHRSHLLHL